MKINNFDKQISSLREESNMTRANLAEKLNVSVRLISYWENGKRECDFDMLIKIADIFGVSIDYLLGRSDY
ncbi:MAG: helix-turn-helix transcriptional regulator [Clostridiales bacterium]|nr:helix-turn-helix transcriptional regulator [Clostridiales bacterium]